MMLMTEMYARAISEITAATGLPFLTCTENGEVMVWGSIASPYTITVSTAPGMRVHISHFVKSDDYLATLAILDRISGAMLRLGIPCEIEQERDE